MAGTETVVIPERARYRGELVIVLAYEGDGWFLVQRGASTTSIRREHLVFLRPVVKAAAVVDEVLEGLS